MSPGLDETEQLTPNCHKSRSEVFQILVNWDKIKYRGMNDKFIYIVSECRGGLGM